MEFKEIVKQLSLGFKVRRPQWTYGSYLHLIGNEIRNNNGDKVDFCNINSFLATDWIIFEEKEETLMVCMICGREDKNHMAYCSKCGRSSHRLLTKEKHKEFNKFLEGI